MSTNRQLDLSPYLSSITEHGAVYDLYAVVNHYGGILYGHYTSFARCPAATSDKSQKDVVGNWNYALPRSLSLTPSFVSCRFANNQDGVAWTIVKCETFPKKVS